MKPKVKQIVLSKYYVYSWILGLVALVLFYRNYIISFSVCMFFFLAFSISDAKHPIPLDKNISDDFDPGSGAI
jgi:hypothetical protein